MKSLFHILILVVFFSIITSCKSSDFFSGGLSSKEIGPEGGTITSSDGILSLTIPAEALSESEMITIEKIDPENLGPEFNQLKKYYNIGSAYELSPDGLEFEIPVLSALISAQNVQSQNGITELEAEILISSRNGAIQVVENPGVKLNADSKVTVYGHLSGFSKIVQIKDVGYSVSTVTREDIEQTPSAGRLIQSIVSIAPNINIGDNNVSIRQQYQNPLSFVGASDIESLEVLRGPQGQLFGTGRTFQYNCTNNGSAFLQSNVRFQFPVNMSVDILKNFDYKMTIDSFVNCEKHDEFEFNISDLNAAFDTTPGRLSLNFSYNISPEIIENSFFKVDWGDGYIKTYDSKGPETTLEGNGSENNFSYEDTHQFNVQHQYKLAGDFNTRVEAWAYESPDTTQFIEFFDSTRPVWNLGTRELLRNEFINHEWSGVSSFDDWFENSLTDRIKERAIIGAGSDFPSTFTTSDLHLKFDFGNVDGLNENLPATPLFSVDRFYLSEKSWAYKLNYSKDLFDNFNLSPGFSYTEFPDEQGTQPLEFELNSYQSGPFIIQLDDSWNPFLVDDQDLFNPNAPTRFFIPPSFSENLNIYDTAETIVGVPGHTLRIFKDGNGSGTVNGYEEGEPYSNGDTPLHIRMICGENCSEVFTEGTAVMLYPQADPGSEFIRFSNNTSPVVEGERMATVSIEEYTTVTATFMKKESEDLKLRSVLSDQIRLSETGSIRGQVIEKNGRDLPGVVVEVTNENGTIRRITVTNSEGRYRFLGMPGGDYAVTARLEGFVCSRSGVNPVLDPIALKPEESFHNLRVNFECVTQDEDDSRKTVASSSVPLDGGPVVKDRTWFFGNYKIGVEAGYPFRPTLINFVEDQVNLDDAEVTNISPTFGVRAGLVDILKWKPYTISADVGFLTGTYDYSQSALNGTLVNGKVRVNEFLTAFQISREDWRPRPYFKTGLNTVFNKNKIEIRNPFTLQTEKEERDHTGLNFLFGGGVDFGLTDDLQLSIGTNYNIGGADSRLVLSAGVNFGW